MHDGKVWTMAVNLGVKSQIVTTISKKTIFELFGILRIKKAKLSFRKSGENWSSGTWIRQPRIWHILQIFEYLKCRVITWSKKYFKNLSLKLQISFKRKERFRNQHKFQITRLWRFWEWQKEINLLLFFITSNY